MKITIDNLTTIPAGVALRLTPEQVAARDYCLESLKKGVFIGNQALQFKSGEEIEIVGKLPKGILPAYDRLAVPDEVTIADQPSEVEIHQ